MTHVEFSSLVTQGLKECKNEETTYSVAHMVHLLRICCNRDKRINEVFGSWVTKFGGLTRKRRQKQS